MRQRVITAVIALIIFIPIIIAGGVWVDIAASVLGLIALSEILVMRKKLVISWEAVLSGLTLLLIILPDFWHDILPGHLNLTFVIYGFIVLVLMYTVFS